MLEIKDYYWLPTLTTENAAAMFKESPNNLLGFKRISYANLTTDDVLVLALLEQIKQLKFKEIK